MERYFSKEENAGALRKVLKSWAGVPYLHMGENRYGVDCSKFVGLVAVDLGLLEGLDGMYYGKDWHIHGERELQLESIEHHLLKLIGAKFVKLDFVAGNEEFGDIICFACGKSGLCNHTGIIVDDGFFAHAINRRGVGFSKLAFSWASRAKFLYRIVTED